MAKKYSATNPRLKAFADRFRKYVDDAGGVNKVSAITGISRVTIGFWYNGERTPDAANMITLAEKTNISVDWFLGLCDERTRDVELQAVCKYTGLSEDAIKLIAHVNETYKGTIPNMVECLNDLLSSPDLLRILSDLSQIKRNADECLDLMNDAPTEELLHKVVATEKNMRLGMLELNDDVRKYADYKYRVSNTRDRVYIYDNKFFEELAAEDTE